MQNKKSLHLLEKQIAQIILPDLDAGRKNFDRPHTEAVVYWLKEILSSIKNSRLDEKVLITAAYAHDWGYVGLFNGLNSDDPKIIQKRKLQHMQLGAKKIAQLLRQKFSQDFSKEQIKLIGHLVSVHDQVEKLSTSEEIILMEADTLGMLDIAKVKPTFNEKDNQVFIEQEIFKRRFLKFIHPVALGWGKILANKRLDYYNKPSIKQ